MYTNESPEFFFTTRVCYCEEPGPPVFNGPGFADLCSICDRWLRRQLRSCFQCRKIFMYIYQHPNMNMNTCWDCVQELNPGYLHKPHLAIIPPEDACVPVSWSEYKQPVYDLPPLP